MEFLIKFYKTFYGINLFPFTNLFPIIRIRIITMEVVLSYKGQLLMLNFLYLAYSNGL